MQTKLDQFFKGKKRLSSDSIASPSKHRLLDASDLKPDFEKSPKITSFNKIIDSSTTECIIKKIGIEGSEIQYVENTTTPSVVRSECHFTSIQEEGRKDEDDDEGNEVQEEKEAQHEDNGQISTNGDKSEGFATPVKEDGYKTPVSSPISTIKLKKMLEIGEFHKIQRNARFPQMMNALNSYVETTKEHERNTEKQKAASKRYAALFPEEAQKQKNEKKIGFAPRCLFTEEKKMKTPEESSARDISAHYERYNYLTCEDELVRLLPPKYASLLVLFNYVDHCVKFLSDGGHTVTFKRLKPDVERMSGKKFTEIDLGKIKAVFPNSYEFRREKLKSLTSEYTYELVIKRYAPVKSKMGKINVWCENPALLDRLEEFYERLVEITRNHHQAYLQNLKPPMVMPKSKVVRWHPHFELDKVPDIEPSPLPPIPILDTSCQFARATIDQIHASIVKKSQVDEDEESQDGEKVVIPKLCVTSCKDLKGIPKSLLEKVRAKQVAMAKKKARCEVDAKKLQMLSRLPEMARIVRNIYLEEKKNILSSDILIPKMGRNFGRNLSNEELKDHLKLLMEHASDWISFVGTSHFVRLTRGVNFDRIQSKLKNARPT